ncbi:MAG TPA: hypothetical protein VL992_00750, partial [Tepidisphaeraceae bacterium]|nr:hypothetical protein [Tepidisphaeraceae bacterium]
LSMRPWMHAWIGAVAVVLAILSPAQMWAARTVLSESAFGTFSVLAMAAYFMHVQTTGRKSLRWLWAMAALSTYAIFVRPNGIALFFALLPAVAQIIAARQSIRSACRLLRPYLLAVAVAVVAVLGWSARNFLDRGDFAASDMTGVTLVCGLVCSGTFDIDCLRDTPLYRQYLTDKHRNGYYYPGFALRHDLYMDLTHDQRQFNRHTLAALDRQLVQIDAESKRDAGWKVSAIGWLRSLWWALVWPDVQAYSKEGIRLDYTTIENISATQRGAPSMSVENIRGKFLPFISRDLVYDEVRPNPIYSIYAWFSESYYNGAYILLSVLGVAGAIYLARSGRAILAGPIYAFLANIMLNVYLRNVFSRYIHILDAFLIFELAMALSLIIANRAESHEGA